MFTNYFIKKKIQALVSDAGGRPHRSLSLDEARSLLVLYNIEDHEDVMSNTSLSGIHPPSRSGLSIRAKNGTT